MSDEKKPVRCGCGGEAVIYVTHWWGKCYVCECDECGTASRPCNTEAEAIEAWNTAMGTNTRRLLEVLVHDATGTNVRSKERTAKVEVVEKPNVFKCSECGQYFHSTAWGSPVEYCSRCCAKSATKSSHGCRCPNRGEVNHE